MCLEQASVRKVIHIEHGVYLFFPKKAEQRKKSLFSGEFMKRIFLECTYMHSAELFESLVCRDAHQTEACSAASIVLTCWHKSRAIASISNKPDPKHKLDGFSSSFADKTGGDQFRIPDRDKRYWRVGSKPDRSTLLQISSIF